MLCTIYVHSSVPASPSTSVFLSSALSDLTSPTLRFLDGGVLAFLAGNFFGVLGARVVESPKMFVPLPEWVITPFKRLNPAVFDYLLELLLSELW